MADKDKKLNPLKKLKNKYYLAKRKNAMKKDAKKKEKSNHKSLSKNKSLKPKRQNIVIIKDYLKKAGYYYIDERKFSMNIIKIIIGICIALTLGVLITFISTKGSILQGVIILFILWTVVFGLISGLVWLIIYLYLDLRIYSRTKQLEEVLPDFLQLTSANISAGMPIDQALWFAVRPKFGILSKEIEEVAKSTIAGADLEVALKSFAEKYKSTILKRSVSLIIEGMRAGGELADLLSKISIDIQETKLMKKEIAASVMTYVIFISFATIGAAPFLFALSTQLIAIIQGIMGSIDLSNVSTGSFNISISGGSISISDFKIFSVLALTVSAIFSASIVSVIRKGNITDGLKYIPAFILVTLILYFLANEIVSVMMGSFL